MIPTGDEGPILTALGYMTPHKVLQWARVSISPDITERDIKRLDVKRIKSRRSIGAGAHEEEARYSPDHRIRDDGIMAKQIDAYIAAKAKDCGVHPDFYRRFLGWR